MSNKLSLSIEGMHCQSCAEKVKTALEQIDNLESISINVKEGTAELEINGDKPTEKNIRRIIDKLGYRLVEVK